MRVPHGPVLRQMLHLFVPFFQAESFKYQCNSIVCRNFLNINSFAPNVRVGVPSDGKLEKLLAELTVFYVNCCREGNRMTDSRLWAKLNLSYLRSSGTDVPNPANPAPHNKRCCDLDMG